MDEIHGVSEGSIVRVTDTSSHKAIDQSSDNWAGNLELGRDEIFPWLEPGTTLEVRSLKESIRGSKVTLSMVSLDHDGYKHISAATYESWPNGASNGYHFDADGHITHYSDKYFDVEVMEK